MKRICFLLVLLAAIHAAAQDLEPNLKWGKPTQAELTMTTYAQDPDADAVELYRLTDVYYVFREDGFRVIYSTKRRLKVLKDDGKRVADQGISYRQTQGKTEREYVTGLKATAYNMENGRVVKTKMERSMVHEERLDKHYCLTKFSVPQVKVGTVIEYEYDIESDFFYDLHDWIGQGEIPVLYTQYKLSIPEWLKFNIEITGTEPMEQVADKATMSLGAEILPTDTYKVTGHHLSALKDDDYLWCADDYACKVTHELLGIYIPGSVHKSYTSTWEDIERMLQEDDEFGSRIRNSSPLKDEIAQAGIAGIEDVRQRSMAVFQLLRQRVRWNGEYAFWAKSGSKVLKEGTGSNADLNFLYINMLHDAGVKASPIVLRSRKLGRLPFSHASLKYLSTFVVGIHENDSTMSFIDCSTLDDGCLNVLPPHLLADKARVVNKTGAGGWINLLSAAKGREVTTVQATLGADGLLTGKRIRQCYYQDALATRKTWRTAKDSLELIHQMQENAGMTIQEYAIEGRHDNSPQVKETLRFTKQCDVTGGMIYMNPLVFSPQKNNPFTEATRRLPIEFPYAQHDQQNVSVTLPEGWVIEEMPKPIVLKSDGITVRILGAQSGRQLTMQYRISIDRTFFDATEYQDIKALFDQSVENCNNMIAIKKMP